jgi:hypothetical protein
MLDSTLHKIQTEAFIAANPADIVLERASDVDDGKGGVIKGTPTLLPPQRMRKVGSTRISGTQEVTLPDGHIVVPTAALIGLPEVDIAKDDEFVIDGVRHKVLTVDRQPPWRVQASVMELD